MKYNINNIKSKEIAIHVATMELAKKVDKIIENEHPTISS